MQNLRVVGIVVANHFLLTFGNESSKFVVFAVERLDGVEVSAAVAGAYAFELEALRSKHFAVDNVADIERNERCYGCLLRRACQYVFEVVVEFCRDEETTVVAAHHAACCCGIGQTCNNHVADIFGHFVALEDGHCRDVDVAFLCPRAYAHERGYCQYGYFM